jgi:hypothetical protein
MADVLHLNDFRPCALNEGCTDGGKARIIRRRERMKFRSFSEPRRDVCDDLAMNHSDPADAGMPGDVAPY